MRLNASKSYTTGKMCKHIWCLTLIIGIYSSGHLPTVMIYDYRFVDLFVFSVTYKIYIFFKIENQVCVYYKYNAVTRGWDWHLKPSSQIVSFLRILFNTLLHLYCNFKYKYYTYCNVVYLRVPRVLHILRTRHRLYFSRKPLTTCSA